MKAQTHLIRSRRYQPLFTNFASEAYTPYFSADGSGYIFKLLHIFIGEVIIGCTVERKIGCKAVYKSAAQYQTQLRADMYSKKRFVKAEAYRKKKIAVAIGTRESLIQH